MLSGLLFPERVYDRLSSGNLCGWIAECFLTKLCINGDMSLFGQRTRIFIPFFLEFVPVSRRGAWMVVYSNL